MSPKMLALFLLAIMLTCYCQAQSDSLLLHLQNIPTKYITDVEKKVEKYSSRITSKTEKTLIKLSRWENKIKALLEKASPETANKLFGNYQLTFTSLLQQFKHGEEIVSQHKAPYNKYRDELTTSLKYLADKKKQLDSAVIKKINAAGDKMKELETEEDRTEAIEQFIKERKTQLINLAFQHLGKSKYLLKINKEAYYYVETIKNYKEIFRDSKKAEATALTILNKIPAFQNFMQQNSQLASLFGAPGGSAAGSTASLAGLQTRASVNALIQSQIASGGPNAQQAFSQNMQAAQAEIMKMKDKLLQDALSGVVSSGGGEMPDFKPNMQKTKTFAQRLEYGFDFQPVKNSSFMPGAFNLGLNIGYKINDKSVVGVGVSYKLGVGSIEKIKFSHEGIGLRSFMDWKLKKQFFVCGGFEMNHNASFKNIAALHNYQAWQQSGLLGISKKIVVKSKLMKRGKLQLMYDFLYRQHVPVSQPVVFRVGYNF